MTNIHSQKILILDFGSQYTQLIARRVREIGVYSEIYSCHVSDEDIKKFKPNGIILSGGPNSVHHEETPRAPDIVFELGCPVLGICYGMQTMAQQCGGRVQPVDQCEFGYAQVEVHGHSKLLADIEDEVSSSGAALLDVWMSHGDQVVEVPEGFKVIARTNDAPIAGMANDDRGFYALQFHPEVTHTLQGKRILERFVKTICGCEALWTMENIIEECIKDVRKQVGKGKVLLGLSGGVDSSVVAALLHKAIGDQLECVFVDNGLLRQDEAKKVKQIFVGHFGLNVVQVDAESLFLSALKGVTDPEDKRKVFGKVFIDVFANEAKRHQDCEWLAQGTIYPDVIESAAAKTGTAHVIKSHHNVGGLPEDMPFKLCEPLRELFKDEVRKMGLELGLPSEMVHRHPFPGPGLGVRILGEVKKEFADILRHADHIFIEELLEKDLYDKVSQAFTVFLPVKSVGVKGDARCYEYVIALRAVETVDFMTARWAHLPYDFIGHVARRIMNEVRHVARVVYDVSGKPPATIEWE
ncbi:MAG: glutamine-hydrolyzing GMP synthase [Gammaproteobacteria bacterium]